MQNGAGSKGMRQMLAYTLLEVLEVPLGQWACSNSAAAMEACSASTSLSLTLAEALWSPHWPGAAGRGAPRPLLFCPPQALLLTDARPWLLLCDCLHMAGVHCPSQGVPVACSPAQGSWHLIHSHKASACFRLDLCFAC